MYGPRITPSMGSKYMLQLRQRSTDHRYSMACKEAKMLVTATVFDETLIVKVVSYLLAGG